MLKMYRSVKLASRRGEGGEPIVEATEYDRLYLVTVTDEDTETFLLRYGVRSISMSEED